MQNYPSWRYHATEPAVIVADPEADDALGEGWADTPAAFLEAPAEEGPECSKSKKSKKKASS
jgi:hypothetical protein